MTWERGRGEREREKGEGREREGGIGRRHDTNGDKKRAARPLREHKVTRQVGVSGAWAQQQQGPFPFIIPALN